MTTINNLNYLYSEIDQLIQQLRSAGHVRLADILFHRLHKVAWTSGSELQDELTRILEKALQGSHGNLEADLQREIGSILSALPHRVH